MDSVQKSIIGYLLMAIVGAVIFYITGKIDLWFHDPTLLVSLGIMLGAAEIAAYKWIKYTFGLPEEIEDEIEEVLPDVPNTA